MFITKDDFIDEGLPFYDTGSGGREGNNIINYYFNEEDIGFFAFTHFLHENEALYIFLDKGIISKTSKDTDIYNEFINKYYDLKLGFKK